MRSGKKFTKIGRPTLIQQKLGERPLHLTPSDSDLARQLAQSLRNNTPAHKEWVADAKLKGVGVGLTQGRKDGGDATQYRSKAFWDYISRNHAHLLVTGNFSDIARRIIRAEDKREDGGWMDADWLNGADTGNKPYKPTFDSLRKLLSTKISGKG